VKARSSPARAAWSRFSSWGVGSCGRDAMRGLRSRKKGNGRGGRGNEEEGNEASERPSRARLSIRKHDAPEGTRHQVYAKPRINRTRRLPPTKPPSTGTRLFIYFSPDILSPTNGDTTPGDSQGEMGLCYTAPCAIGWLYYRIITPLVLVENRKCIVASDISPNSFSLLVANLPKSTKHLTGKRLAQGSPARLRQGRQRHHQISTHVGRPSRRRMPRLPARTYITEAREQSHLHLFKVGYSPLVIPTILLQTLDRKFDIQTSLLAQSRHLDSLGFGLRLTKRKCEIHINNTRGITTHNRGERSLEDWEALWLCLL